VAKLLKVRSSISLIPPPIDRDTLDQLIGMYRGIVTRNVADTGNDSPATKHAQKILGDYLTLRERMNYPPRPPT
jgi:hypothetical protein